MNVKVTAKKMQTGDTFVDHAQKKLSKLDRFFGEEGNAKIVLSSFKNQITAELTVTHGNLIFRAEQTAIEKDEALDGCVDRIIRQIRKNKTKVEKSLRDVAFKIDPALANPASDDDTEETTFHVIRKKQFVLRPMNVDEAILRMNLLGHVFFVFSNAETGEINVVYKRDDGDYAVLEAIKK